MVIDYNMIMNFTSLSYYLFLLILIILINISKTNKKYFFVLLFNLSFCFLYGIKTLIFIILISLFSFLSSKLITKDKKNLWLGILPIIILLITYKVLNFYNEIIIPVGLSFYSLQAISYLVDLSKDNNIYIDNFFLYFCSLSFFPSFSSGPINKIKQISDELKNNLKYDETKFSKGIQLIAEGLFKKLVLANRLVEYVDQVYNNPNAHNGLTIMVAIFFYSLELYCDFSAYSDIAIGSASLLGIELKENFNCPYFSKNIQEFWRRWHISLSSFLRDYIYIPLGGSRCSKLRKYINVIITFLVSGLWHGLGLNYFIWGLFHGLLNILSLKKVYNKFEALLFTVINFILVSFSWVFFRASNLENALLIFKNLFTSFSLSYSSISKMALVFTGDINFIQYCLMAFIMILILFLKEFVYTCKKEKYHENIYYLL